MHQNKIDDNPTLALRLAELLIQIDTTFEAKNLAKEIITKLNNQFNERKIMLFKNSFEHLKYTSQSEFSSDGTLVFSSSEYEVNLVANWEVTGIWDVASGERDITYLRLIGGDALQTTVSRSFISPSKKFFLTISNYNMATIWDVSTGSLLQDLEGNSGAHPHAVFFYR